MQGNAGCAKKLENFCSLGEQNPSNTILQLTPWMRHSDCFYSDTTSQQQENKNWMIQRKRMKRKRIQNKVMPVEMEMQNQRLQSRRKNNEEGKAFQKKLKKEQEDYAVWYQRCQVLHKQKPATENLLPSAIEDHCNMVI